MVSMYVMSSHPGTFSYRLTVWILLASFARWFPIAERISLFAIVVNFHLCSSGRWNHFLTDKRYRRITTSYHSSGSSFLSCRYQKTTWWFSSANRCSSTVRGVYRVLSCTVYPPPPICALRYHGSWRCLNPLPR